MAETAVTGRKESSVLCALTVNKVKLFTMNCFGLVRNSGRAATVKTAKLKFWTASVRSDASHEKQLKYS